MYKNIIDNGRAAIFDQKSILLLFSQCTKQTKLPQTVLYAEGVYFTYFRFLYNS
jgi:hypothetical protein